MAQSNNCPQYGVISNIERRQDRLEDVADRLTSISADLSRMIAVHEQRITQQEKQLNTVELLAERRREEVDEKFADVSKKIEELKKDNHSQYEQISIKILDLEKMLWKYAGAFSVIAFALAYGPAILKLLNLNLHN